MLSKTWIEQANSIEAPMVGGVNFQVRTGISAPFEPHMTGDGENAEVKSVNFQVRTGISAPFEPHMTGEETTTVEEHERVSVPSADFMATDE